jgi:preprotein translocase SecE subunit
MAVAVKTSTGARSSGALASPAILSLIGVLYLLGCLGIVFELLPGLWWSGWESLGLQRFQFVGGSLLVLVAGAAGVGLLVLGGKLLGPHPPVGVRAGVFVAFVGLLVVVGLTRWASRWIEHWAFDARWFGPGAGAIATAVVGGLLLVGWIRLFTRPAVQKLVLKLEAGGWFSTTSYKANQGQKVRRGTIFGILLLVGAGIYTLISHGTLRKGSPDLLVHLPFTGKVVIESYGDTEPFIDGLPAEAISRVEIRLPGDTKLPPNRIVSFETYQKAVAGILADLKPELLAELEKSKDKPALYLRKVNEAIYEQMQKLLELRVFRDDAVRRLREIDQQTDMADLSELIEAFKREAATARKTEELGPVFNLPTALLVVDRFAMREVNDKTDKSEYVKIGLKGDSSFTEGEIVSREKFDAEVDKLKAEKKKGRDRELPQELALAPARGRVVYADVVLLPSLQFTVPLLLLALSLWLAWRIVNMPTFADFLIATEAELNKVSWTTQKRLVQDTIVVLVTVALMAVFLFGMDWTWKVVLSWKPIGVLHIPPEQSDTEKKIDQKRW